MGIVLILHSVRSVHNVASIFRTADAAGVEKMHLTGVTPAPLDRFGAVRADFKKVSLGAERAVPWEKTASATRTIKALHDAGYAVYAVEQSVQSIPYYRARKNKKIALILGNEVRGLPESILKLVDAVLEIPMRGVMVRHTHHPRRTRRGKESLNVAVAAGIVLFGLRYKIKK